MLAQQMEAAMDAQRFDGAADALKKLECLSIIDNVLVTQLLTIATQRADAAVRTLEDRVTLEILRDSFDAAAEQLQVLDAAVAALSDVGEPGDGAARVGRTERTRAHLARRSKEKAFMDELAAQVAATANDKALLEGQLQAVQAQLGRYDKEVEEMREAQEAGKRAAEEKLEQLQAGFGAQLKELTKLQEQAEADKDATEEERQRLAAQVQQLERERHRQVGSLAAKEEMQRRLDEQLVAAAEKRQREERARADALEEQQRKAAEEAEAAVKKAAAAERQRKVAEEQQWKAVEEAAAEAARKAAAAAAAAKAPSPKQVCEPVFSPCHAGRCRC